LVVLITGDQEDDNKQQCTVCTSQHAL